MVRITILLGILFFISACTTSSLNGPPTTDEWHAYKLPKEKGEVAFTLRSGDGSLFKIDIGEEAKNQCLTVTFSVELSNGRSFTRWYENGNIIGETSKRFSAIDRSFFSTQMIQSLPMAWNIIVVFSLEEKEERRCGKKFNSAV